MLAWLPECGWTLTWSAPKSFLRPVDGQALDGVDMFAAAVPAFAGIALGVFVGEHRALGLHHGGADKVLAGDQLDVLLLALLFQEEGAGDFGVHAAQTQRGGGGVMYFHGIDTTLVTAPFKGGGQKDVEDFNGQFRRGGSGAQAENVGVVVLAAERGHGLVEHQGGPRAGDFVGGNADADPGGADQQAKLASSGRHLLPHGVAEFGVVARPRPNASPNPPAKRPPPADAA